MNKSNLKSLIESNNDLSLDVLKNNFIKNNDVNINSNKPEQVPISKNIPIAVDKFILKNDPAFYSSSKSFDTLKLYTKSKIFTYENLMVEDKISNNYLIYLWNDYICCKNTKLYKIKEVKKVLSFNNIVKMSFEHYLRFNMNFR